MQQLCLPSEEEQLGASLTGAVDVAVALHQLFETLKIETCITISPVWHHAALQRKKAKVGVWGMGLGRVAGQDGRGRVAGQNGGGGEGLRRAGWDGWEGRA